MDECRDGTVTLHGRTASGPLSWSVDLRAGEIVEGRTVGVLAARARIREIEEGESWLPDRGSRQRERKTDLASSEIVRLATEYGLSSRETSWVVIERREVPLTGEVALRKVPVAVTSGWRGRDQLADAASLTASMSSARLLGAGFGALPASSPRRQSPPQARPGLLSRFKRQPVVAREDGSALEEVSALRDVSSSMRALDRLVALQRADGSWDLDEVLARIFGLPLSRLELALAGAKGDSDEARRAWATALAIRFLTVHASSNRGEWEWLADKAARWLAGVSATPARGTWMELAEGVQFAGDLNA
jgi:hypothetical protein